jgi:DNA-binding NtrC family response regulator
MGLFNKLTDMKILLVDDDEWIRDSLILFFECEGCHLVALETAEEGVEALKSQSYDIIISDYKLPGMDGLEFFKLIGESHPDAMMILVTAYGNIDVASEAIRIGIHDFIHKPFTTEDIERSLGRLIEKREKKRLDQGRRRQVVRQGSAKPSFSGSTPLAASIKMNVTSDE